MADDWLLARMEETHVFCSTRALAQWPGGVAQRSVWRRDSGWKGWNGWVCLLLS